MWKFDSGVGKFDSGVGKLFSNFQQDQLCSRQVSAPHGPCDTVRVTRSTEEALPGVDSACRTEPVGVGGS